MKSTSEHTRPRRKKPLSGSWRARVAIATLALAAVTSLAAAPVARAAGRPAASGSTAPESSSVSYPLTGVSAGSGGLVFAVQKGYFTKYGLKVTVPSSSEGPIKTGVASGSIPIDGVAGSDVLDLQGHNSPVEIVACAIGTAPSGFHMIVKSSISSAAQIPAGAKIGVPSLLGAPQFAADEYFSQHGINPAKFTYVPLGSIPDVLAALESGQISVAPLSVPFNLQATEKGFKDLGIAEAPPTPVTVNKSWAAKNPNTILAFLKGYIDGVWYYDTHKTQALPVLASFLGDDLSNPTQAALVANGYAQYLPPSTNVMGQCTSQSLNAYIKFFPASEQKSLNSQKLINNTFVDQLAASGFYKNLAKQYGPLKGVNPPQ
jgi:ABC-type nitrate/sulfonate/bicarbonate transport system substrate-binding protein